MARGKFGISAFMRDEHGATAIEYALIAGFVSVVVLVGVAGLGRANQDGWGDVAAHVSGAG